MLKEVNTFVTDPKQESCVDEKISGLEHFMATLIAVFKWKDVKEGLKDYADEVGGLQYKFFVDVLRKYGCLPHGRVCVLQKRETTRPPHRQITQMPRVDAVPVHARVGWGAVQLLWG